MPKSMAVKARMLKWLPWIRKAITGISINNIVGSQYEAIAISRDDRKDCHTAIS